MKDGENNPMALTGGAGLPRCTSEPAQERIRRALEGGCYCRGTEASVRRRLKAHGGVVVTVQCDRCGRSLSGDLSRHHFPFYLDLPEWDALLPGTRQDSPELETLRQQRLAEFETRREEMRQAGATFRATPEWQRMRRMVLARARFTCEACGEAPAEAVHHLDYAQGQACPLYNLRAVCRPCHERLHRVGDPWHLSHLPGVLT